MVDEAPVSSPTPDSAGQSQLPRQGLTDVDLRHHSQELGVLGKLFGSKEHAPINIAGAIIVFGILGLVTVPLMPVSDAATRADLMKSLGSLVLASLTFMGGYLGGGKKD